MLHREMFTTTLREEIFAEFNFADERVNERVKMGEFRG